MPHGTVGITRRSETVGRITGEGKSSWSHVDGMLRMMGRSVVQTVAVVVTLFGTATTSRLQRRGLVSLCVIGTDVVLYGMNHVGSRGGGDVVTNHGC